MCTLKGTAQPHTYPYTHTHMHTVLYICTCRDKDSAREVDSRPGNEAGCSYNKDDIDEGVAKLCGANYVHHCYWLVGRHCQRAMALLTLLCVPLALIWTATESVLTSGVDTFVHRLGGTCWKLDS